MQTKLLTQAIEQSLEEHLKKNRDTTYVDALTETPLELKSKCGNSLFWIGAAFGMMIQTKYIELEANQQHGDECECDNCLEDRGTGYDDGVSDRG